MVICPRLSQFYRHCPCYKTVLIAYIRVHTIKTSIVWICTFSKDNVMQSHIQTSMGMATEFLRSLRLQDHRVICIGIHWLATYKNGKTKPANSESLPSSPLTPTRSKKMWKNQLLLTEHGSRRTLIISQGDSVYYFKSRFGYSRPENRATTNHRNYS